MNYKITISLFILTFFAVNFNEEIKAQETDNIELIENLTPEQLKILKEQKELIKNNKTAFKASLDKSQLQLLSDAKLSVKERQKALLKSLTQSQRSLLQVQKVQVQQIKDQFLSTITTEQRERLRERLKARVNSVQDKKELIERVRERRRQQKKN